MEFLQKDGFGTQGSPWRDFDAKGREHVLPWARRWAEQLSGFVTQDRGVDLLYFGRAFGWRQVEGLHDRSGHCGFCFVVLRQVSFQGPGHIDDVGFARVVQQSPKAQRPRQGSGNEDAVLGYRVEFAAVATITAKVGERVGYILDRDVIGARVHRPEHAAGCGLLPVAFAGLGGCHSLASLS